MLEGWWAVTYLSNICKSTQDEKRKKKWSKVTQDNHIMFHCKFVEKFNFLQLRRVSPTIFYQQSIEFMCIFISTTEAHTKWPRQTYMFVKVLWTHNLSYNFLLCHLIKWYQFFFLFFISINLTCETESGIFFFFKSIFLVGRGWPCKYPNFAFRLRVDTFTYTYIRN